MDDSEYESADMDDCTVDGPTSKQLKQFRKAVKLLTRLCQQGYSIYQVRDTMHLVKGPTHDEALQPLFINSMAHFRIDGSIGAEDW